LTELWHKPDITVRQPRTRTLTTITPAKTRLT